MRGYFFAYFLEIDMALRTSLVAQPHLYMGDTQGRPLDAGKVYFGEPNKDPELYPVDVYYDEALTIAAPQPIRTMGGFMNANGQMVEVYAAETTYSVKVLDAYGRQVFYQESMSSENAQLAAQKLDTGITATAKFGGVERSLAEKNSDIISVKDFGIKGDGSDERLHIQAAWYYCILNKRDLYFPSGIYSSGADNMPFKHEDYPANDLLDCNNITIYGEGASTVFMTKSSTGADVLNLYSVKNLHFRNLALKAELSSKTGAGSNGLSIVGGFDNITLDSIWIDDMPYVDKGSYLDGGKAFTIQTGVPTTECGTVRATNIFAKGCVYGFGLEIDLVNWSTKKHSISVDMVAENCYTGVIYSAGAATAAVPVGMDSGVIINAQLINCQKNVVLSRAHGVEVNAQLISTKSKSDKALNPEGDAWNPASLEVVGLTATYAKDSNIKMTGSVGECDYKAKIGGIAAGSSGQDGTTSHSNIYLDISGTAATADIEVVNAGGNVINECDFYISSSMTSGALPALLYNPTYNNAVTRASSQKLNNLIVGGALQFAHTDGINTYNSLKSESAGVFAQQTLGSTPTLAVLGVKNNTGAKKWFVRNDGAQAVDNVNVAASLGALKNVMPVYDIAGVLRGYVPIYTSYT